MSISYVCNANPSSARTEQAYTNVQHTCPTQNFLKPILHSLTHSITTTDRFRTLDISMTRDHNDQLHAGTIGLFDDDDEIAATEARIVGRNALVKARQKKKIEKATQKHDGFWHTVRRAFGFKKKNESNDSVLEPLCEANANDEGVMNEWSEEDRRGGRSRFPEMYDRWEVDEELDSPFYEELGMVRIKAANARDVKVVHKSQIRKDGVLDDYGE